MNENIKNEIIIHCQKEFPNEACGLLVGTKKGDVWFPCKNVSPDPTNFFTISTADYAKASDKGEIKAVVHSHTLHPTRFSEQDIAMQKKQGIPWVLVGMQSGEPELVWLDGKKEALTLYGRTYSWGINDCYSFIRDYFANVVGKIIPDFQRAERFWEKGEDLYRKHFADAGFVEVNGLSNLMEGDVLIISLGGTNIPSHGAVYLGNNTIGHHLPNRLSCKEVYGRFYQARTVLILRHKDLT